MQSSILCTYIQAVTLTGALEIQNKLQFTWWEKTPAQLLSFRGQEEPACFLQIPILYIQYAMYLRLITFLFHEEWGLHCGHRVVHYTLVLTKGMSVIWYYIECKLIRFTCGDDSAILDPWNTTGGRVATISCTIENGAFIVLKSGSARLDRNCSWFCYRLETIKHKYGFYAGILEFNLQTYHSTAS